MLIGNFESLPLRKPTCFQSYISLPVPPHGSCISNSTPFQAHPGLQLLPIPTQSITRIVRFYETTNFNQYRFAYGNKCKIQIHEMRFTPWDQGRDHKECHQINQHDAAGTHKQNPVSSKIGNNNLPMKNNAKILWNVYWIQFIYTRLCSHGRCPIPKNQGK
jgi:hypothetical protein